jgi:hypothetical protein
MVSSAYLNCYAGLVNVALKEWAAVVEALGRGTQILLLRKGGIVEARRGFELRHQSFLLFPTFEHQHARFIRPEFHHLVPESAQIRIRYLARVTAIFPAPDMAAMQAVADRYIWNDAYLQQRYEYRPDLPLYAILVRAHRLSEERVIPHRPSYAGCKSWVNLTEEIPVEAATPVLSDDEFETAAQKLLRLSLIERTSR